MRRLPIVVLTALALGGTATAADSDLAAKLNSNRVELGGLETDFGVEPIHHATTRMRRSADASSVLSGTRNRSPAA